MTKRNPAAPAHATVDSLARTYGELFPAVYLAFHRRDSKRAALSSASRAVLMHLAQTGPLPVSECARHLDRAQSVVSEILEQLERKELVARITDARDRRRHVVWLTDSGRELLVREHEVLAHELLAVAISAMAPRQRTMLIEGTRALIRAAGPELQRRKRRHHESKASV